MGLFFFTHAHTARAIQKRERFDVSKRRSLNDEEHQLVRLYLNNTDPDVLADNYKDQFISIKHWYELDGQLSDRQLGALRKTKQASDAIKWRRKSPSVDIGARLNRYYNPARPRY